jgi:hypothetical protein
MFCRAIWKTFNSGARLYLIVKVRLQHGYGVSFIIAAHDSSTSLLL